jgi:hypothetical protein
VTSNGLVRVEQLVHEVGLEGLVANFECEDVFRANWSLVELRQRWGLYFYDCFRRLFYYYSVLLWEVSCYFAILRCNLLAPFRVHFAIFYY